MKFVVEYLDGTKDIMDAHFKTWEEFRDRIHSLGQVYSLDFVTDKGVPMWVPSTAVKRIYPK